MSEAALPPVLIVALGASNTAGYGVGLDMAYPAVVERLLRSRSINASIANAGVPGDTTAQMLERLDRDVPAGTCLVMFQPGSNDARLGTSDAVRERNIAAIQNALCARGIEVVRVARAFELARPGNLQPDGIHYTTRGHEQIAYHLIEDVIRALGRQ